MNQFHTKLIDHQNRLGLSEDELCEVMDVSRKAFARFKRTEPSLLTQQAILSELAEIKPREKRNHGIRWKAKIALKLKAREELSIREAAKEAIRRLGWTDTEASVESAMWKVEKENA